MNHTEQKRTLNLGECTICYLLLRKQVKRINLRIDRLGEIRVSAAPRVPVYVSEDFMRSKKDAILSAVDHAKARCGTAPSPAPLTDGSPFLWFGRPLTLSLTSGNQSVARAGNVLLVSLPEPTDEPALRHILDVWLRMELETVIDALCTAHFPYFAARGIAVPTFRYRRMISCWGSCRPDRGVITINTVLAQAPLPCVEYVLVHELVHLIVGNHSADFYTLLASLLPDWAERRNQLKEIAPELLNR